MTISRNNSNRKRKTESRSTKYNPNSDLPIVQITTKVTEYSFGGCGTFRMNKESTDTDTKVVTRKEREVLSE